ncbi:Peptidase S1, PA clan,Serine proteases, trypsin domain [Cinara cedri]|uniref:Peptidase S1, PA clan,Serine proteases, trypsin domain n=1 Tax=Cinara cedri TaxID=506608 RepID=A0A5E4MAC3_9HEMI|nr:Peptidase S1, PA clan,Serine proteases, trypsin domain [Cinara cedri]
MLAWWCFVGTEFVATGSPWPAGRYSNKKLDFADGNTDVTAEFPFVVGLISNGSADGTVICTGTLVSPVFVLSTAHCASRLRGGGGIKAFRRIKSATDNKKVEYRQTLQIYTHPLYDSVKRVGDLSLIRLKRPFRNVGRFVRLSSDIFADDIELDCLIIGIGFPHEGHGYKVPVRVQYGRNACKIPELNPALKYVIAYTWPDFLCAKTTGRQPSPMPCDRGDALVCHGDRLYGVFSYGYNTGAETAAAAESRTDCGAHAVQGRHLFVNRHFKWIADTLAGRPADGGAAARAESDAMTSRSGNTPRSFVPENHPYLVYLEGRLDQDEPTCGGSLISSRLVLTSAYCTIRMSEIEVYLLTTSLGKHTNASYVYIHPDFDLDTLSADISIVVLWTPLIVRRYVGMADTVEPPVDDKWTEPLACTLVTAKKWGQPYGYFPVQVEYGPRACRESIDSEIQNTVNRTWREFVCSVPGYGPHGETGDPLICDGLQYAITSHWYAASNGTEDAADPETRFLVIDQYKKWIDDVAAETRVFHAVGRAFRDRRPDALTVALLQLLLLEVGAARAKLHA